MAPVSDVELDGDRAVSREDCLCPICLEIYMEPVTLPCTHTFCKVCFLESVDKATLCCPLCRKRVSTWARQHSRNKSLVNEALWNRIQKSFPQQCTRRGEGQEGEEETVPLFFPKLSEPGALRQEYEDQINQLTEEKEQERRASEEYIRRLLAEEEQLLLERQRRHHDDERLARILSQELNTEAGQSRVPEVTPVKKGHIDRFLSPIVRNSSPAHSSMSNKENILVRLNSPTRLPQLDYYGPETDQSEREETEQPQNTDQSEAEDRGMEGGTKRKSSDVFDSLSDEEEDDTQGKRSCQSSCLVGVAVAEWEAELQKRRLQEEEDRLVAQMLQRELDKQERQTDRRKGSADAYPLRASQQRRRPHKSSSASKTTPHKPSSVSSTTPKTQPTRSSTTPSTHPVPAASSPAPKPLPSASVSSPPAPKPTSTSTPAQTPFKPPSSALSTLRPKQTPNQVPQRQTTITDIFSLHRRGTDQIQNGGVVQ